MIYRILTFHFDSSSNSSWLFYIWCKYKYLLVNTVIYNISLILLCFKSERKFPQRTQQILLSNRMTETCYDDSIPAKASNFLKLVGKYGYCQDDSTLFNRKPLDPCHDLYILMCFAAVQIAFGSVQIIASPFRAMKSFSKIGSKLYMFFPFLKCLRRLRRVSELMLVRWWS